MTLRPANLAELQSHLAECHSTSTPAAPLDLSLLNSILAHTPEDMTATVQTGLAWTEFQKALRSQGQWLPLDPPEFRDWSVADVIASNLSGPRRVGYGTIRDYLIGIKVVLADGRLIKAGGNVVKNVAGYDLCKLFIGSRNTLGIPVEATFKLRPLPEAEVFLEHVFESLPLAGAALQKILQSALQPTVLDLVSAAEHHKLVIGFDGMREDVQTQEGHAQGLGMTKLDVLAADSQFWNQDAPQKTSVLPSELIPSLQKIAPTSYIARAGNGVIYSHGGTPPPPRTSLGELTKRLKEVYDPNKVLPAM